MSIQGTHEVRRTVGISRTQGELRKEINTIRWIRLNERRVPPPVRPGDHTKEYFNRQVLSITARHHHLHRRCRLTWLPSMPGESSFPSPPLSHRNSV